MCFITADAAAISTREASPSFSLRVVTNDPKSSLNGRPLKVLLPVIPNISSESLSCGSSSQQSSKSGGSNSKKSSSTFAYLGLNSVDDENGIHHNVFKTEAVGWGRSDSLICTDSNGGTSLCLSLQQPAGSEAFMTPQNTGKATPVTFDSWSFLNVNKEQRSTWALCETSGGSGYVLVHEGDSLHPKTDRTNINYESMDHSDYYASYEEGGGKSSTVPAVENAEVTGAPKCIPVTIKKTL